MSTERKNVNVESSLATRLKVLAARRRTTIGALADQYLREALDRDSPESLENAAEVQS